MTNSKDCTPDGSKDTTGNGGKPTGYETIRPRLKDVRERILAEIEYRGGGVPITTLRSEQGADIPSGSVEHHLAWLQGREVTGDTLRWWPEGAGEIIQEIGREDMGYGNPVRVIGLTEYGEAFVEEFLENREPDPKTQLSEQKRVLQNHSERISSLEDSVEEHNAQLQSISESISELKEDIEANKDREITILEEIEDMQDQLGIGGMSSDE